MSVLDSEASGWSSDRVTHQGSKELDRLGVMSVLRLSKRILLDFFRERR